MKIVTLRYARLCSHGKYGASEPPIGCQAREALQSCAPLRYTTSSVQALRAKPGCHPQADTFSLCHIQHVHEILGARVPYRYFQVLCSIRVILNLAQNF